MIQEKINDYNRRCAESCIFNKIIVSLQKRYYEKSMDL